MQTKKPNKAAPATAVRSRVLGELRDLVDTARAHYAAAERRTGLPASGLRVLSDIVANPATRPSEIAARLRLERPSLSNLLRELEDAGLVVRGQAGGDRRCVAVRATPAGRRMLGRVHGGGSGLLATAVAGLSASEARRLSAALAPLIAALRPRVAARARRKAGHHEEDP